MAATPGGLVYNVPHMTRAQQLGSLAPGLVLVLVALAIPCALSGELAVLTLSRLMIDGGVTLGWTLSAAGLGAGLLKLLQVRRLHSSLHIALSLGLGWGLISLVALALGMAGLLSNVAAWVLLLPGWGIGAWLLRGRAAGVQGEGQSPLRWMALLAAPLLGLALYLALIPAGLLWRDEPNGYDVVAYHLQLPREWYELGRIATLNHNVFSYFPLAMETHYLMAMKLMGGPWAGMYTAQFMHVAFFGAAALGAYGAIRSAGRLPAMVAMLAVASCPYAMLLAPVAYNEGTLILYGVLVLGLLITPDEITWREAVVAGLCAGFAAGAKLTAIPLWVVAPVVALLLPRPGALVVRLQLIAVFIVASFLAASPWLIRTGMAAGGNPVFPLAARTLGHAYFTPAQVERFERAHSPRPDQQALIARIEPPPAEPSAPRYRGRLPEFYRQVLIAPEFGYVVIPAALVFGLLGVRRSHVARALLVILVIHAGVWLFATHLQGRFFVPTLPVLALLFAAPWFTRALAEPATSKAVPLHYISLAAAACIAVGSLTLAWNKMDFLAGFRAGIVGADYHREPPARPGLEEVLINADALNVPQDVTLTLVGDARAYFYTRPMRSLKYTSVFDAVGPDPLTAWRVAPGEAVWTDPGELERFNRTYFEVPPLPPELNKKSPFLLERR